MAFLSVILVILGSLNTHTRFTTQIKARETAFKAIETLLLSPPPAEDCA